MIKENILSIKERIKDCAQKSGQDPGQIQIIGVTKYAELVQIKEVLEQGLCDLGENKLQSALQKMHSLYGFDVRWHMVGHLQSNKVKKAVEVFDLIHSADSLNLISLIDKEAAKIGKIQKILLQINIQSKKKAFGFLEEELISSFEKIRVFKNVSVCGLMTIAPFCAKQEETRPFFRKLKELKLRLEEENDINLPVLSMGMSEDFETAVEEGATMLRIGRAIFKPK